MPCHASQALRALMESNPNSQLPRLWSNGKIGEWPGANIKGNRLVSLWVTAGTATFQDPQLLSSVCIEIGDECISVPLGRQLVPTRQRDQAAPHRSHHA